MARPIELSVIMPAYNEQGSIAEAIRDVQAQVFSVVPDAELLIVDDGSTDATRELALQAARQDDRVKVVHQANAGHGAALLRGIDDASGNALLLLDSDRQIDLADFGDHWARMQEKGLTALLGVRKPRHDPMHRLVITKAMRWFIHLLFGFAPQDGGAPYKLVTLPAWHAAARFMPEGCSIPSVLLASALLRFEADTVQEIRIVHLPRNTGRTVLRWGRLARLCRAGVADVLTFRRNLSGGQTWSLD